MFNQSVSSCVEQWGICYGRSPSNNEQAPRTFLLLTAPPQNLPHPIDSMIVVSELGLKHMFQFLLIT